MDNPKCCNCTPVVGTRFRGEGGRSPATAITEAVAAAEGVAPAELDPIYHDIDLEAVDSLLADQNDASIILQVVINGWKVFVCGDGAIRVCDPDLQTDSAPVFAKPIAD